MPAEKGLEGHAKTLALTVQTTGSHEGQQGPLGTNYRAGDRQTGRQAGVPTAVRLEIHITFLSLSFIICTMGVTTAPPCKLGRNKCMPSTQIPSLTSSHSPVLPTSLRQKVKDSTCAAH